MTPARSIPRSVRRSDRNVTATPRRRWARILGVGCAVVASLSSAGGNPASAEDALEPTGNSATGAGPSTRATDQLTIVDQTFNVTPDGSFELTIALPPDVDPARFDERSILVVTGHRAIADRFEFQQATIGDHKGTEDTFDISLDPAVPDPNVFAVVDGTITVRVPTESVTRTPEALQMSQSGVHAVVLELRRNDRPVANVTTYVNRLPSIPSIAGPLSVSIVTRQLSMPTFGDDGTIAVSDTAQDELALLASTLASIDAAGVAGGVTVPRGVQVEPSVLQAVVDTDPDLAASLLTHLAPSDLLASPRLPLDPSSAVAAGEQDRYGDWLRRGEDILDRILPNTAIDRSVVLVDDRLSSDGAALQRTLGAQLLVMPYDFYTDLDGNIGGVTDISQLLTVELDDGQTMKAAIADEFLGSQMVSGADEPMLAAVEIAAELVVLARDIDIDDGVVENHGVVLALPDLGVPDPAFMAELVPLLLESSSLRLVSPRELGTNTTTLLNDGRLVTLTLPAAAGPDIAPRLERLDEISDEVLAYASMLPDDSPDIARWSATLEAFPSTALTDVQADAAIDRLRRDFTALRGAIVTPDPFSFTLTGPESKLRFSLANASDTALRVRVSLSSPKLRFPDGDQIIEIAPQSETDVVFAVEALSNGKSSVFLRILAPARNVEVQLVPEVVLTARVNSFAGLGQLITGVGLLLVISWWVHHVRSDRRKAGAARHQSRHPAARLGASSTTAMAADTTATTTATTATDADAGRAEVSPDAAASSLPHS